MGWLLLLPLIFAFWLAVTIANSFAKKGGGWRLIGVLSSFIIGGICVQVGYWFGIEGSTEMRADGIYQVTYPVLGWIMMIGGGLIAILGTWTAIAGTKEEARISEEKENKEDDNNSKGGWAKVIKG